MTDENQEIVNILEQYNTITAKKKMIVTGILWGTTGLLVILKAMGLSQLSWFWTTFILLLPLYMIGAFLAVCVLVLIGAMCVFGIIVGIEAYENRNGRKVK